jgi:hypothetical protein
MSDDKKNDLDGRKPEGDVQRGCTCGAAVGQNHASNCGMWR